MSEQFLELCQNRYSVRKFSDRQVEDEKIEKILMAGQVAPTACNYQPIKIYTLKSKEAIEKLQKCKVSHFGETLAFLVCYDKDTCWTRGYDGKSSGDVDASIVATHMMLEAWEQGIGSTWMMHFIPEAITTEFSIPDNLVPVCLLVMGYADEGCEPNPLHFKNKPLSEISVVL